MISFIGGTGPEGKGLALRFALAGEAVVIGSRDLGRATDAALEVQWMAPKASVEGTLNPEAAERGDLVFITVPFSGHRDTLEGLRDQLRGKIVVDTVVPITFEERRFRALVVDEGSVAEQAQAILPESRVVGAFHNVSAAELLHPERRIESDVVVCGDDRDAKASIMALAERIHGVRALDGTGLDCSRYVENVTALLLNLNRVYKGRSTIKFLGI